MEIVTPPDCTPVLSARALASQANGARSNGPVTDSGKARSSVNSVRTGFASRAVLLPGEQVADYEATIAGWAASLGVRNSAEAFVAARVADVAWRQERLVRYEQDIWSASVENELKETDVYLQLSVTRDAHAGVQGMALMAEQIGGTLPGDHVRTLMPALQHVLILVERADAPMEQLLVLRDRVNDLAVDTMLDIQPKAFHELAQAARALERFSRPRSTRKKSRWRLNGSG